MKQVKECASQAVLLEISSQVETRRWKEWNQETCPAVGEEGAGEPGGAGEPELRPGRGWGRGTAGQVDVAHGAKILVPTHGCATLDFACRNLSFVINNGRRFYPPCPFR